MLVSFFQLRVCVLSSQVNFQVLRDSSLSKRARELSQMTWKAFKNSLYRGIIEIPGGHWEVRGRIPSSGGAIYHVQLGGPTRILEQRIKDCMLWDLILLSQLVTQPAQAWASADITVSESFPHRHCQCNTFLWVLSLWKYQMKRKFCIHLACVLYSEINKSDIKLGTDLII